MTIVVTFVVSLFVSHMVARKNKKSIWLNHLKEQSNFMKKIIIEIDGMKCGMCEAHVCDILRKGFYVKKVKASHLKNQAEIVTDVVPNEDQLKSTLAAQGYVVKGISVEEYERKGLFSFKK